MNEYILDFRTTTDNCTTNIINRYILVFLNTFFSLRLRLHERGFISIRFHDFKTAPKLMRFGSVYTEPFSYSLRHAEVITDQRDPSKKESTILFFSSWRNVDLCSRRRRTP